MNVIIVKKKKNPTNKSEKWKPNENERKII